MRKPTILTIIKNEVISTCRLTGTRAMERKTKQQKKNIAELRMRDWRNQRLN